MYPKYIFLLVFLASSSHFAFGQISDSVAPEEQLKTYTVFDLANIQNTNPISISIRAIDMSYEGVKGSPYYNEDFETATLLIRNGEDLVRTEGLVQLDIYKHELWVQLSNTGEVVAITPDQILSCTFNKSQKVFQVFESELLGEGSESKFFAEVLLKEEFVLLKLRDKSFRKADYSGAYGNTGARYDKFILKEQYYLAELGGAFQKIKLQKKSIEKALPNFKPALRDYFTDHKAIKTESELLSLLNEIRN